METLKEKFLLYIHRSDSFLAEKIRSYLPKTWINILYDYELNDVKKALIDSVEDLNSQETNMNSDDSGGEGVGDGGNGVGGGVGGISYDLEPISLQTCWDEACPKD
jgi:hypothetical protein